jgi:hypothetical protein
MGGIAMTAILGKRFRYIEKTIRAIYQSPAVKRFVVGITASPQARRISYRSVRIPHFVILASGFTQKRALEIERSLQMRLNTQSKYHPEKKNKKPRASVGGSKRNKKSSAYSL